MFRWSSEKKNRDVSGFGRFKESRNTMQEKKTKRKQHMVEVKRKMDSSAGS